MFPPGTRLDKVYQIGDSANVFRKSSVIANIGGEVWRELYLNSTKIYFRSICQIQSKASSCCGKLIPRLADNRESYSRLKSIFHISYLWRVYWTWFSSVPTLSRWHQLVVHNNCSEYCNLIQNNFTKLIIKLPSLYLSRCLSHSVTRHVLSRDTGVTTLATHNRLRRLTRRGPRLLRPGHASPQQQPTAATTNLETSTAAGCEK